MNEAIKLQGRELDAHDIDFIQQLLADNPTWSRRKLSIALAQAWDWRNAKGDLKDMASRTMLNKLNERGYIQLPPRRQAPPNHMVNREIPTVPHDTSPIEQPLTSLQPLRVINVSHNSEHAALYNCLLAKYHYLSYTGSVGENMKYLVLDNQDRPIACLLFGSAAWACAPRDTHVGWDRETRQRHINWTTNNTRFLVAPWVRVPHLASHVLGLVARRITHDWLDRYGHPIYCLETFVERDRFKGTCYRAANWQLVGQTQGRSRNDVKHKTTVAVKDIYLYPLHRHYRQHLCRSETA